MVRGSITDEVLRTSPSLLSDLCEFVVEVENRFGSSAVAELPIGLKRVLLFVNLDSEVSNGGFEQYFGNRTHDDGTVERECVEVIDALRSMGCLAAAGLVEEAAQIWKKFVAERIARRAHAVGSADASADSPENTGLDLAGNLDLLDSRYNQMQDELQAAIEHYARTHEAEFVYPASPAGN